MNNDLISREALLKKYCKEPAKGDCKNCDWYGDSWCRCEIFGVQIAEATAIDAVEVVHGKWDDSGRYQFKDGSTAVVCSKCGCAISEKEYQECNWFYCPVCGARMDGNDNV